MIVEKIDFNDPRIKKLFTDTKKRQRQLTNMRGYRYEGWFRWH